MLRPPGDSWVAWVMSLPQPLCVRLSTGILGCSSLGSGKALGTVPCDCCHLPGLLPEEVGRGWRHRRRVGKWVLLSIQ